MSDPEVTQTRTPTQEINPVFVNRWSPRGITGEELDDEDLMALFEAARRAPSSYTTSFGDSFMQKEIPKAGIDFLTYWLRVMKHWPRIR